MQSKRITMQQIGDLLGVTKVSVSKALNRQSGVSEELRAKVLATAAELGYALPAGAATLDCRVAFVVPKRYFVETDRFYTAIYYYMQKLCANEQAPLSLTIISPSDEREVQIPAMFSREHLDAICVAGQMSAAFLQKLGDLGLPVLAIDINNPAIACDCVVVDNFYYGHLVTKHLIDQGHREIGFVGSEERSENILDRYFGYKKALMEHGIIERPEWFLTNNEPGSGAYSLDFSLPEQLPTAFVCHCDMAAHFLMQRLMQQGVSVPEEVSLISFDNTELALRTTPPLTSLDIDKRQFAESAFAQIKRRIGEPELPSQRIYLSCTIVERGTVRRLTPPR